MHKLLFAAFLLTLLLPPRLLAASEKLSEKLECKPWFARQSKPCPPALATFQTASEVEMIAQTAFGGRFKYGEWLPIFVTVENSGSDLTGEIQATITGQSGQLNFAIPAELPAGARKRFTLYTLPNNFSRSLKIELKQGEETLLSQEVKLSLVPNDRYVIGVVAAEMEGMAAMNPPQLSGRRERAELINLALEDIPERHEGLRLLNALILNDVDTSLLSPDQRTALKGWVAGGGRLIIGGGASAGRTLTGLPAELQPVTLTSQQEVAGLPTLEAFTDESIRVPGPFLLAGAQPVAGTTVLLYGVEAETSAAAGSTLAVADTPPLVVEQPLGAGRVNFVALDLSQSPFDAWAGVTDFAERLLSPGAAWPDFLPSDIAPQQMRDSQMSYALTNLPALDLPSIRFLGLLLVGYIILVGPVNYFLLRWRDRLAWAWVTIPILTLAFSALAYGVGLSLRGGDIIVNQISVIEMSQDGQTHQARTYVGIFSPSRTAYDVEVEEETLIRPLGEGNYDPWSGSVRTGGSMSVVQGDPARVRGLAVNQWSMQSFVAETTSEIEPGLTVQLKAERDGLRGSLVNEGTFTWQDVILIFNAQFQKLGDVAPGQEVEIQLDFPKEAQPIMGFGSYVLYQDEFNGPTGPSREVAFKQNVLDSTIFNGNQPHLNDNPILIAWLENSSPLPVNLAGRRINNQKTSFLYASVPISFDETYVAIPPGFSHLETLEISGDAGTCNYGPGMTGYHVYQGTAEIKLSLPDSLQHVRPQQVDLYIRTDGSWPELPMIELYDQIRQEWVSLEDAKMGANPIQDLERFYDQSDAATHIRVSGKGNGGGCLFFELALEGERL